MSLLIRGFVFFLAIGVGLVTAPSGQAADPSEGGLLAYSKGESKENRAAVLQTIARADLPPEARKTLSLIKQGGPFPYVKDGVVFGNREGRLPGRPRGYYREYTVKTPGSSDRGARRIVGGSNGEFYYTDDHYNTFKLIKD